ncbi:hypothetical protein KSP40_PGU006971 [Platanthera guangdongensis]|uniref:GBF-interacting protein 1 N-terminal domain-containing protein n=1 Tax=Platanthera guangdongensis TaxID=2320717 RepID=A0ABR2MG39_9ASPA
MSGYSRASIPNSVKKTIQDINEIAVNHSDEEIYAMLKECSMDPNETIQKLLFQDTFHEVKRKRDKRKESIREISDTRWRPETHVRGGRGGRGNYIPRYTSHDTRKNIGVGKENGTCEGGGKGSTSTLSTIALVTEDKAATGEHKSTVSISCTPNGPIKADLLSSVKVSFSEGASVEGLPSIIAVSTTSVYASSAEPIIFPSLDGHATGAVGAIKHEIGMPQSVTDTTAGRGLSHDALVPELPSICGTVVSDKGGNFMNGKIQGNFQEIEGCQVPDIYQVGSPSSSITDTSGSRPSSNYSNRSHNPSASIKAGPAKEWKPKSTIVKPTTASGILSTSGVDFQIGEVVTFSMPVSNFLGPDDGSKMQKKLEDLLISEAKHVIIPDHLQVSESERSGLNFGSFDSNFTLTMQFKNEPDSEERPRELSESSIAMEEFVEEFPSSTIESSKVAEENSETDQQSSVPGSQSEELDIPSSISPGAENHQSKLEASSNSELHHSVIHTAPVYSNFGLVPPMLGNHFPAVKSADPQAHDTARVPTFVVPQTFDPSANYYASLYRPAIEGDCRFSPPFAHGAAAKYNGSIPSLLNQTGQSSQENGSSLVLSSTESTTLPQAGGLVQTSAVQQPVPIFRQPTGVHISHYPPNYVHYNQYISPFYFPPPASIHHLIGNAAAFHQQPPPGSMYPLPTATAAANPLKYPISQYKPGTSSGGLPGQGMYGLNSVVYSPTAVSGGNSAGSEDLASSQYKECHLFNGQQTDGSAIWMPAAGRDISSFQGGSFYNVPSPGQPVAFTPTHVGHGAAAFAGIYHPTLSLASGSIHPLLQQSQPAGGAAEISGPPAAVYPHRIAHHRKLIGSIINEKRNSLSYLFRIRSQLRPKVSIFSWFGL